MNVLRDADLQAFKEKFFSDKDDDQFSKTSDLRIRKEFASRYMRGNVEMQNGGIVLKDFDLKLSEEITRLLAELDKPEK